MSLEPESLVRAYDPEHLHGYMKKFMGMIEVGSIPEGELLILYLRAPRLYPVVDDSLILKPLDENWRYVEGSPSRLVSRYFEDKPGKGSIVELTALDHVSIARVTFPAYSQQARLVIDLRSHVGGDNIPSYQKTIERVDGQTWRIRCDLEGDVSASAYMIVKFSEAFDAWGTFQVVDGVEEVNPGSDSVSGVEVGFYVEYTSATVVEVLCSLSFKDFTTAEGYLSEYNGVFDDAVEECRSSWNEALSRIEAEAPDPVLRCLYTNLYAILLNLVHLPDGESPLLGEYAADVVDVASSPTWNRYRYGFHRCLWDEARNVYPLIALLYPEVMARILDTLLASHSRLGFIPQHEEFIVGRGDHSWLDWSATTFLWAYQMGVDYDYASAIPALKDTLSRYVSEFWSLGYVPGDKMSDYVTRTYEHGVSCLHLALLARHLGLEEDYQHYIQYARVWLNNWDGSAGYPRGRDSAGEWMPLGEGFFEGDHESYRFYSAMTDPIGLWDELPELPSLLRDFLLYRVHFNDCFLHYFHLPIYVGDSTWSQWYLRGFLMPLLLYIKPFEAKGSPEPDGLTFPHVAGGFLYPSNAALTLWLLLGLTPQLASGCLLLSPPLVDRAVLHTGHGDITIEVEGQSYPLSSFIYPDCPGDHYRFLRLSLKDSCLILAPESGIDNRPLAYKMELQDFAMRLKARWEPANTGSEFWLIFRFRDLENYCVVKMRNDGLVKLEKKEDNNWTLLTEASYQLPADGQFHDIELEVEGESLILKVDGEVILTYDGLPLWTGLLGLSAFKSADQTPYIYVDSLTIQDDGGSTLLSTDFTDPCYIESAALDGRPLDSLLIDPLTLVGKTLKIRLSPTPRRRPLITAIQGGAVKDARYDATSRWMRMTIDGPEGLSAQLIIDCADLGEPTAIRGAKSYSYDPQTGLLRLTAELHSPTTIEASWSIDPKKLLVDLLSDPEDGVKVYDDEGQPIPGRVSAAWPDEHIFKEADWQITVGPVAGARVEVLDIGARHKAIREHIQLSIWVLRRGEANYTPERLRRDLIREVERILFKAINDPGGDIEHINLSSWMDRDEPEHGILRSILTIQVEYERVGE